MASLYQRFTGKINTNNSFPNPPEASHLLGQGAEGERPAESQQRPRLQHQHSRHSEDEDVRINLFLWPFLRTRCALLRSDRLRIYRSSKPIGESIYLMPFKSLLITTHTFSKANLSNFCVIASIGWIVCQYVTRRWRLPETRRELSGAVLLSALNKSFTSLLKHHQLLLEDDSVWFCPDFHIFWVLFPLSLCALSAEIPQMFTSKRSVFLFNPPHMIYTWERMLVDFVRVTLAVL